MAIEITASGADDIVLAQVAADAGHPVTHAGSTRNRIEQVAADAAVVVPGGMSDRNAIEALALLLESEPAYVFALDDDGTLAAAFGLGYLPADAPAYLTATHAFVSAVSLETYAALISAIENAVDATSGGVYAYQVLVDFDAVALGGGGDDYRAMCGSGLALIAGGVPVLEFSVGVYVKRDAVELRAYLDPDDPAVFLEELAGYVPGEHVIGVYVDADAGRIGLTFNGADKGYVPGIAVGEVDAVLPCLVVEQRGDITAQGWVASLEMVPVASGITEPVPAGAKDLYQQAIG